MIGASEALRFDIFAKDEFSKSFDKLINKLPSVKTIAIAAAGGLAAVGTSLLAIAKTTATAYDQIGKFSDQTGFSTEFLSKMNVAAQFTHVNINTMNKSLERLQIGIGEAAKGIGLAKDTLADFGIPLNQVNGQLHTTETILPLLADRFKEMTSDTERTEAAQKLFGQRGIEMIKILKDGSEGLAKYSAEAEAMGLIVDKQGAANAAKFNDALFKVKGTLTGLKNEIGERIIPIITGLAEKFSSFTKTNREQIIQFGATFTATMGHIAEKGAKAISLLNDSWRGLKMLGEIQKIDTASKIEAVGKGTSWLTKQSQKLMNVLNYGGIFDKWLVSSQKFRNTLDETSDKVHNFSEQSKDNLQKIVNEGLSLQKTDEFINKIKIAIEDVKALGTAEITGGGGITEGPGGVIFDLSQFDLEKENYQKHMEDLAAMHDEYFLTDQEKLDQWYTDNLGKYSENNDAMIQLREIYDEKQRELDEQQAELDERLAKRKIKTQAEAFGKIAAIGKAFGADFFKWTKGAAIAEATINTYQSAVSAFAKAGGYPWGIFPAAASIAYGLAQVATISQQSYAHGGLTNVPREQTMLVDEGERILSPNQNADLTKFMADGGSGGGTVVIENMNILPNATNAELLLELNKNDWDEIVEYSILPAIRRLTDRGFAIA